jgi:peptidoglycan/xylan/chitin deacetylase (PgdA/CDA1 family)
MYPEMVSLDNSITGPVTGSDPVLKSVPLPGGARIAVNFQMAVEAWAAGRRPVAPVGARNGEVPTPNWVGLSAQEYGVHTGVWRLLKTFEEYGVHACCSMNGFVAERWPEVARAVSDAGHEILGHGYYQDQLLKAAAQAEDLEIVESTTKAIEDATGQRPVGWSSQGGGRGTYTVDSLLRTGYLYSNDFLNADVPYIVAERDGRKLVAVPRTNDVNDIVVVQMNGNGPALLVDLFKRAFDQLYKEGATSPAVSTCVVHATISGKPWAISALRECIEYAKSFPDVWICRRREVAENYLRQVEVTP